MIIIIGSPRSLEFGTSPISDRKTDLANCKSVEAPEMPHSQATLIQSEGRTQSKVRCVQLWGILFQNKRQTHLLRTLL
jgi:hypothetical protein